MANKIVQFGWKTEAIPIAKPRKSLITRIFQEIFTNIVIFRNISCFEVK